MKEYAGGMLKKIRRLVSFTRAGITRCTSWRKSTSKRLRSNKTRSSNVWSHCHQITLDRFIRCLLHNDFSVLRRSGNPSQRELSQAWEHLYMEYCDLSGDNQQRRILMISREVGLLESKLLMIQSAVMVLSIRYSQKMVDLLHQIGYNYTIDPSDPVRYMETLERILKKSKIITVSLEQKRYEYEQLTNEIKGEPLTEQYFEELMVELSRFLGDFIRTRDVTVTEFIAIRKRFDKEIKETEKAKQRINAKTPKR